MARAPALSAETEPLPEPDKLEGSLPRLTERLYGHAAAEQGFLDAFNSGRLHHAWIVTGPPGIGKATLCYRIARFLSSQPAANATYSAARSMSIPPPAPRASSPISPIPNCSSCAAPTTSKTRN